MSFNFPSNAILSLTRPEPWFRPTGQIAWGVDSYPTREFICKGGYPGFDGEARLARLLKMKAP